VNLNLSFFLNLGKKTEIQPKLNLRIFFSIQISVKKIVGKPQFAGRQ